MRRDAPGEDFKCSLRSAVKKQLSSPIEIVLLIRIKQGSLLILVYGGQGIVELFIEISKQMMQLWFFEASHHSFHLRLRTREFSLRLISQSQIVGVCKIIGVHTMSGLKQWDCFAVSLRAEVEIAELLIGFVTSRAF